MKEGQAPGKERNLRDSAVFIPPKPRIERVEELTGNLISFIAKTQEKSINNEYQLAQLEWVVARLETRCKSMHKEQELILQRIERLESRVRMLESENAACFL